MEAFSKCRSEVFECWKQASAEKKVNYQDAAEKCFLKR